MISLKNIERPSILTPKQHQLILGLIWGLITTNDQIKENKSIYGWCNSDYKVLDKQLAREIDNYPSVNRRLKTKSMAEYLVWKTQTIPLIWSWIRNEKHKSLDDVIVKYYLYPFFEDKTTISDNILYMWFDLFKNVRVQKISDGHLNMYIWDEPMDMFQFHDNIPFAFEYYTDFSRDRLLEIEIALWYTNKTIGDPTRGYWYTHMLRANVWEHMVMPANAIRLIKNWRWFNVYLTSRKQGKTSFAADRIVAELLSEKRWYGMRKNRRIKFFTDNAAKVWTECMQFIADFLWDLVKQEISPGVKYFEIRESKQEVICNLTGNSFAVVSLKWLQWDSDNSTGDGLACDAAIIDEWFRIGYRFWKSFRDRAKEECEWILFISTLNEEAWCNPDYNTVRSSDFDNSVTYHNNFLKRWLTLKDFYKYTWNKLKERLKETNEEYIMKRILCWILSDRTLFDVTGRIAAVNDKAVQTDLRVIWIDMWGLSDHVWVCEFNVRRLIVEKWYSHKIDGDYQNCLVIAREAKEKYPNCITVWDRWWPVWEAVAILDKKTQYIDYWIKSTGNSSGLNELDWYYTMKKWVFVLSWAYALTNIVKIMMSCTDLITQFWDMEMKKSTRWGTILYKAKKGRKDDAVFWYLNVFWLLRIIFQLLSKEDMIDFAKQYWESEVIAVDDSDEIYYTGWMTY